MANKIREGGTYSPLGKTRLDGEDFNFGIRTTKGIGNGKSPDAHRASANHKRRSPKIQLRIHGDGMMAGGVGSDGSRRGPRGR